MPRYPVQQALATMWWGPLRRPLEAFARRVYGEIGSVATGPLRKARMRGGLSQLLGIYELPAQRAFLELMRWGDRVFDVGAHIGFFSLLAAKRVGAKGMVLACEPNPNVTSVLRSNISLNFPGRVEVVEAAVTRLDGPVGFACNTGAPSTEGHLTTEGEPVGTIVEGVTLDTLAGRFGAPDVVKIDVEGFASDVLHGGRLMFGGERPRCLIEVHSSSEESECRDFLRRWRIETVASMRGSDLEYPRHLAAAPFQGR